MQEEQYWEAVQTRDASADGTFVYAVRSTGIYCNPSCPSRRPRRQQVVFFALPEAAEEAGFRACRRCYPDEISLQETQVVLVQEVCRYIETHLHEALTLEALRLAQEAGARTVDLTSRPSREAAGRLYQRVGFAERSTRMYRYTFG